MPEIEDFIMARIEALRKRILDSSRRNPLISTKLSGRGSNYIRVVDEIPDSIYTSLTLNQSFDIVGLPDLEEDPRDENTPHFRNAYRIKYDDKEHQAKLEAIETDDEEYLNLTKKLERKLKDEIRRMLGMEPRVETGTVNLTQHAKNNNIVPSFELPHPDNIAEDGRHTDSEIQTLLLPQSLNSVASKISQKVKSWQDETGLNVFQAAFGFLEWNDATDDKRVLSPIILLPIELSLPAVIAGQRRYKVKGAAEIGELNPVLKQKFENEFDIAIPEFESGSIEEFFKKFIKVLPQRLEPIIKRNLTLGVFPSAKMAMYLDLDTSNNFEINSLLDNLLGGSLEGSETPFAEDYEVDQPEIEKKVPFLVADADSSQFSVLVDVANGKNLAVEGPPGSGKSQTIVNAIANALNSNKKVLFVAEKTAALDVVKSRLDAIKLGRFLLPLQATKSSKSEIYSSISKRLEMPKPSFPDDIEEKIKTYQNLRKNIQKYITGLTSEFNSDFNYYDIFSKYIATEHLLHDPKIKSLANANYSQFNFSANQINEIKRLTADYVELVTKIDSKNCWFALEKPSLDTFAFDGVSTALINVKDNIIKITENIKKLENLGLYFLEDEAALLTFHQILFEIDGNIDQETLTKGLSLHKDNKLEEIKTFILTLKSWRSDNDQLKNLFHDPLKLDLSELVISLTHYFKELKITDRPSFEQLNGLLQREKEQLRNILIQQDKIKQLLRHHPDFKYLKTSDLDKITNWLKSNNFNREILDSRSSILEDKRNHHKITKDLDQIESLRTQKSNLNQNFILNSQINLKLLKQHILFVEQFTGIKLLSKKMRNAAKFFNSILLSGKFNKRLDLPKLKNLVSWLDGLEVLNSNSNIQKMISNLFEGLNTDTSFVRNIINFYHQGHITFGGINNLTVREIIFSMNSEILLDLPSFSNNISEIQLEEFENFPKSLENRIKLLSELVELLHTNKDNISNISNFDHKTSSRLESLHKHANLLDQTDLSKALGDLFKGIKTDLDKLDRVVEFVEVVKLHGKDKTSLLKSLSDNNLFKIKEISQSTIQAITNKNNAFVTFSKLTGIQGEYEKESSNWKELINFCDERLNNKESFFTVSQMLLKLGELDRNFKIKELIKKVESNLRQDTKISSLSKMPNIIEALIFHNMAKTLSQNEQDFINTYDGQSLNDWRKRLGELDKKIIQLSNKKIAYNIFTQSSPPQGEGRGRISTYTETALLNHITRGNGRKPSARNLIKRAGNALLELKPCWMMSPLAIAQYIPKGEMEFDLCIIDEASQMTPENALGCLLRSKQVMVVGDTKQLPPTNFFRSMFHLDEDDEDEHIPEDSILDLANAIFSPKRRLRWHYRSKDSSLIEFSNKFVYDDDLIIFPSSHQDNVERGVSLYKVSGLYKSGTNPIEVNSILKEIISFMEKNSQKSLGVVALNQRQSELIQEQFDYEKNSNQKVLEYLEYWETKRQGLEPFFVKNLENVQGDERDVIFISTVYGPEQTDARVMQRFGPINGISGKRRLNVLFSRAREKIVTFSSMTSSDITADENNPGAFMLKNWLEYSKTGNLNTGSVITSREPDSDFERHVIEKIENLGFIAIPQVGVSGYFIDIGVKHPDWPHGFILGVECDGAAYHSSKSARDRDRLRQEVLENLGWKFHRIWSTDWFRDALTQVGILQDVLTKRLDELKNDDVNPLTQAHEEREPIIEEDQHFTDEVYEIIDTSAQYNSGTEISVGSKVEIKFLDKNSNDLNFLISDKEHAPPEIVGKDKPLASQIMGYEEGDEITVLLNNVRRTVKIVKVN